jgi:hypothetical protein
VLVWDEVRILSHIGILARDVIVEGRAAQIGGIGGMMMYPEVRERDFATVGLRHRRHTRSRGSSLGLSGQQADLLGSAQATEPLFQLEHRETTGSGAAVRLAQQSEAMGDQHQSALPQYPPSALLATLAIYAVLIYSATTTTLIYEGSSLQSLGR